MTSLCGALITLALNATLLGHQALKVATVRAPEGQTTCTATLAPLKANAVVTFKDAKGRDVLTQKVYLTDFDFYLSKTQRGGVPAKESMVFLSLPSSVETSEIVRVELKTIDGTFDQTTRVKLPSPKAAPKQLMSLR